MKTREAIYVLSVVMLVISGMLIGKGIIRDDVWMILIGIADCLLMLAIRYRFR